jgi:hypothetical protein
MLYRESLMKYTGRCDNGFNVCAFNAQATMAEFYERAARFGSADGFVSFAELAAVFEVSVGPACARAVVSLRRAHSLVYMESPFRGQTTAMFCTAKNDGQPSSRASSRRRPSSRPGSRSTVRPICDL